MEALIEYYIGAIATISLIIETLKTIDDNVEKWSLKDTVSVWGINVSWLKIIGTVLSLGASIWLTVSGGLGFVDAVIGFIAIFFTQYGAGKIGWRNIIKLLMKLKR